MKTMKRILALTLAMVMVFGMFVNTAFAAGSYADVSKNAWYYDAVQYASEHGLMDGVGSNRFDPTANATRAMVVTILHRLEGKPSASSKPAFTDLTSNWYKDAVAWASEEEIVNGMDSKTFAPGKDITREQLATIIYRYVVTYKGIEGESSSLNKFSDANKVHSWATEAMKWAVGVGLITGIETGSKIELQPLATANRAQLATILMRVDELVNEEEEEEEDEAVLSKIVIFNSSLGSILNAFGKSDCVVGAYGSLAESFGVPSCGKWNEVDVEAVIATGAEAMFGYEKYTTAEQVSQLEAAGVACYFVELSDADKIADEIEYLGEIFGCEKKAAEFVDLYEEYEDLLADRLASADALTVYVEGTSNAPKTANGTSAAHKLVEGAGLINLYEDHETTYPERNLEDVIVKDPDIVVKLCGGSAVLGAELYNTYTADLAGVEAVDNGKVILLNNECGTTAIGSIIGRLYIAKFAYPELFKDIDVDAVYNKLRAAGFCDTEKYTGSGAYFK